MKFYSIGLGGLAELDQQLFRLDIVRSKSHKIAAHTIADPVADVGASLAGHGIDSRPDGEAAP